MYDKEDDNIDNRLEEVKYLDPDLFEDDYDDDNITHNEYKPHDKPKNKSTKPQKIIIIILSFLLLWTILGPVANTFNIVSIQFLKKSYQLSQRNDIQEYKKAIVTIKAEDRKGTGFNVSSKGLIITNYHIVKKDKEAIISFPDGPTESAKVIKILPKYDIAILKLDNQLNLPFLHIEINKNWRVGDHIYFIGNPLMFNQIANEGEIIGETNDSGISTPAIVIDAPVYKGNSGSPIINQAGKVIGVIYAKGTILSNQKEKKVGFIIPIDVLPNEILENYE